MCSITPVNTALSLWKSPSGRPTTTICIFWLKMMARVSPPRCAARCSTAASAQIRCAPDRASVSVARDIVAQYDGRILAEESLLGGACMEVIFGRRATEDKDS